MKYNINQKFWAHFYMCPKMANYEITKTKSYDPSKNKNINSAGLRNLTEEDLEFDIYSKMMYLIFYKFLSKEDLTFNKFIDIGITFIKEEMKKTINNKIILDEAKVIKNLEKVYDMFEIDDARYIKKTTIIQEFNLTNFINEIFLPKLNSMNKNINYKMQTIKTIKKINRSLNYTLEIPFVKSKKINSMELIKFTNSGVPYNSYIQDIDLLFSLELYNTIEVLTFPEKLITYDFKSFERTELDTQRMLITNNYMEAYKILLQLEQRSFVRTNKMEVCKKCLNRAICMYPSKTINERENRKGKRDAERRRSFNKYFLD